MKTTSGIRRTAVLVSVSVLGTLLLLSGFVYAVKDILNPVASLADRPAPSDAVERGGNGVASLDVTALGDSLAKGTGDDTGSGFSRRVVDLLNRQGAKSKLINNLGINGLTTKELLPMLEEPGVQYSLKQAGVILLSIGANDLFDGEQRLETRTEIPTENELEQAIKGASTNLVEIVKRIHEINPQAQLVYIGLYNPFSDMKQLKEAGDEAVARWNAIAAEEISSLEGSRVTPTADLFTLRASSYLSGDHFHPNGTGYQAIAERIAQGIAIP
ncbi:MULTISPECIES: GDSL-type esterase/lipase family protein [Paenibacillus]|uniref:GDSL-type esterase/lipase family protein n=1 Tax=Paenibacillus TaxID=44249 RepID=UPI002FE0727E